MKFKAKFEEDFENDKYERRYQFAMALMVFILVCLS